MRYRLGAPGAGDRLSRCSDGLRSMGSDRIWNGPGIALYSSRVAAIAESLQLSRSGLEQLGGGQGNLVWIKASGDQDSAVREQRRCRQPLN